MRRLSSHHRDEDARIYRNCSETKVVSTCSRRLGAPAALFGSRSRNAKRNHQDRTLARRMRREEFRGVVVVERETRRATAKRICREICASAEDSRFEMRVAIAAISERTEDAFEVRHVNDQRAAIHPERLLETQVSRLGAKVACLQQLESTFASAVAVNPGLPPAHGFDDQIRIRQE